MRAEEDWSVEDLGSLLDAATVNFNESIRCHEAGAPRAALVMLAGAIEALLLGTVVAHEDELRAAGLWPPRPSREHLVDLASLTRQMGWLSARVTDEVVEIFNKARTMSAHPGAYVRAVRHVLDLDLDDRVGYQVVYEILVRANRELAAAYPRSMPGGPAQPAGIGPAAG